MRPIRFRAWNKLSKSMRPDAELQLSWLRENDDFVLMQFTGLLDRDGKEVYEGDLVDFAGIKPLEICWSEAGFVAPLLPYRKSNPTFLTQEGFSEFAEVIGNIYENPELIPDETHL